MITSKDDVRDFWDQASCGEKLYLEGLDLEGFRKQAETRYELEPFIIPFADFEAARGKGVLEVGVGLGADHQRFAEAGAVLTGVDLTPRAIEMTRRRFGKLALKSDLKVGDAEDLDFPDNSFDIVYSWGVIHHSPATKKAANEIFRVLKPGGVAKVMIYHKYSIVGFMLWLRYAILAGRPFTSLDRIYANYLESPGTKAYSEAEARNLFQQFENVSIKIQMSHGDLLTSKAGQRHEGVLLNIARLIWPRWLLMRFFGRTGLFMLIEATKPSL
jgi:ubiquinone/menaquinone biosynthesis C-methylase UbiE